MTLSTCCHELVHYDAMFAVMNWCAMTLCLLSVMNWRFITLYNVCLLS